MQRKSQRENVVARLWREHLYEDFPDRLRGQELAGIDMVMLDADIAGCVVTWQGNRGCLDEDRHQILAKCIADVDTVLPLLTETREVQYYKRLRELAVLASEDGP
jgi:hypothetical protein